MKNKYFQRWFQTFAQRSCFIVLSYEIPFVQISGILSERLENVIKGNNTLPDLKELRF